MKPYQIRITALVTLLIGIGLLFITARKSVTIEFESQRKKVLTTGLRVVDVLKNENINLQPEDFVSPKPNALVRDGQVIQIIPAAVISVSVDGEIYKLTTVERRPANILALMGISLYPGDHIVSDAISYDPDQNLPYLPTYDFQIRRGINIELFEDGINRQIYSGAATIGQALWEAGVRLSLGDTLQPLADTPLDQPVTVNLTRGRDLNITIDGKEIALKSSADTVGAALAQGGIPLQGLDYSLPEEDEPLPKDGKIELVRVNEVVVLEHEPIPFSTELQPDPESEIDSFSTIQVGQFGLEAKRVRVRYQNGEEVSRQIEDQWVARHPLNKIQGYGTKIVIRTLDTPDGPIEYWRAVNVYATSYSPCRSAGEEGRCYPGTSLGLPVQIGIVGVIKEWWYPMAQQTMYIPGYGNAVIADIGGGIPGRHWIDLAYSDDDYVSWHDWITVYFTTPLPSFYGDEIIYILPTQ